MAGFESILLQVQLVVGGLLGFAPLIRNPSTGEEGPLAFVASPLRTAITVLIIALSVGTGKRLSGHAGYAVMAVYCLYLCATAYVSPAPGDTLRYAADFALVLVSLALVTASMSPIVIMNALLNVMAGVMIVSTLFALAVPSIGVTDAASSWGGDAQVGSWHGIFLEKNGLGCGASVALGAMMICWTIWRAPASVKILAIASAGSCFIMARSANAVGGLVAIIGADLILRGRVSPARAIVTWAAAGMAALAIVFSPYLATVFELLGRDASGNNRTLIWAYAINVWQMSPWFGHGFVEGTLIVLQPGLVSAVGKAARHSHNGYIEALVDTGWFGAGLLVSFLVYGLVTTSIRNPRVNRMEAVALRGYQAILVGGIMMAAADIATFRMTGGLGILTWCTALAAFAASVGSAGMVKRTSNGLDSASTR